MAKLKYLDKNGKVRPIKSNIDEVGSRNYEQIEFKFDDYVPTVTVEPELRTCIFHEWRIYHGFTENYRYCECCGIKEPLDT